jgi:hypothetical protein
VRQLAVRESGDQAAVVIGDVLPVGHVVPATASRFAVTVAGVASYGS